MTFDSSAAPTRRGLKLGVLLVLALSLRLGWGLTRPATESSLSALPDQRDYLSIARNLLHGRGMQFLDARFEDTVYAFRTPGYPLFLAACGADLRGARAMQALLDTSTVLAVYLLARLLTRREGETVPLLAAGLVAFNPFLIYFTALLLTETLFTAMLAWAMVCLAAGNGGRGPRQSTLVWLLGCALAALAVLVRPSAVALPVVLGIASTFVNRGTPRAYEGARDEFGRVNSGRWPLPVGLTTIALVLLVLLPWAARNRSVLGQWVWLDTNGGFTLYDGYNPDASGESNQAFVDREPQLQALGEVDRSAYLSAKAFDYARTHASRVWELIGVKLSRTWSPMPLSSEYRRPELSMIALAFSVPFDIFVVVGLFRGKLARPAKVFLLAPAIYFSIIHALTVGSLRYRIPSEPPMALLAAVAIAAWVGAFQSRRSAPLV